MVREVAVKAVVGPSAISIGGQTGANTNASASPKSLL
jgi:hypothetical protein